MTVFEGMAMDGNLRDIHSSAWHGKLLYHCVQRVLQVDQQNWLKDARGNCSCLRRKAR